MPGDVYSLSNPAYWLSGLVIFGAGVWVGRAVALGLFPLAAGVRLPEWPSSSQGYWHYRSLRPARPSPRRLTMLRFGTAGLDGTDLPYRWGLGGDLAPGASTTVTGHIKVTQDFKTTKFRAALVDEPDIVVQTGVGMRLLT